MYSAMSIDTSIFERSGLKLETGLMAKLEQFRDGPSRVVISEIVIKELKAHLCKKITDVVRNLNNCIEDAGDHLVFSDVAEQVKAIKISPDSAMAIAEQRLNRFLDRAGVIVIPVDGNLDVNTLLEAYFQNKPPFEEVGKKKAEFPDALALYSMENWAENNGKKIIAVSADKGWSQYAKSSKQIDVVSELSDALAKLQPHNKAFKFCDILADSILRGKAETLVDDLSHLMSQHVSSMQVYAEASSYLQFQYDYVECTFDELCFWERKGKAVIKPVEATEDSIVIAAKVRVVGEASTNFDFYVHDSIDKDDFCVGGCASSTDFEFDTEILFKVVGDFDDDVDTLEIEEFEVLSSPSSIDFGDVEPDYGNPDDDEPEPDFDEPEDGEPDYDELDREEF